MSDARSLYVDDQWFKSKMKEKKKISNGDKLSSNYKNYPVDIKAIKIRWFINSEYGKKFLI